MQFKMKMVWLIISSVVVFAHAACGQSSGPVAAEAENVSTPAPQILKTGMGNFAIVSACLVDEVHDSKAPDGYKFLLIGLTQPDLQKLVPGEFSLETFQNTIAESHDEIYILGKDNSRTFYSQMGGWVEDDFVIGFTVPVAEGYILYWHGNAPIPLNVGIIAP